jgi:hypothetical protein
VKRYSSQPLGEGLLTGCTLCPPIRTLHPLALLFAPLTPSPGEAYSPISEPPPAAKMHNWEEAGWEVGGVDRVGEPLEGA